MSKYCTSCGREITEGSYFCDGCGTPVEEVNERVVTNIPKYNYEVINKTNGWAIAGFVTSLCNIILCGLAAPISLTLSIVGIVFSKKYNGDGKGLSIAGIIISAIFILLLIIVFLDLLLNNPYSNRPM